MAQQITNLIYDICFICLKNSNNLTCIKSQDINETSIEDKLKYFLPGFELKSNIPKYICTKCAFSLNESYEFKQKCLQNITTYEKCAQRITTTDKYLSDIISRNETEINVDPLSNELFIKEEMNEELDDGLKTLLHEVKVEQIESDDTCNKNEVIIDKKECSNNEKLHKCEICNKSFKFSFILKRHKLIHTNTYTCEVCQKSFRILEQLNEHKNMHTDEASFSCEICNKSFKHPNTLKIHKRLHTGEKLFTCEVCSKPFTQLNYLKRHHVVHTGEKAFTCDFCEKSFSLKANLLQHLKIHKSKSEECAECGRKFSRKTTLKNHIFNVHRQNKPVNKKRKPIINKYL